MLKNFGIIALTTICITVKAQNITYPLKGKVGHYSAPAKAYLLYQGHGRADTNGDGQVGIAHNVFTDLFPYSPVL